MRYLTHLAACVALSAAIGSSVMAEDWRPLPTPSSDSRAMILTGPMRGFYGWHGGIIPLPQTPTEGYTRFAWADLEPLEDVYDFGPIDRMLTGLKPGQRLAFGILSVDTCCSAHRGLDLPGYLLPHMPKAFWMKADPGNDGHVENVYVPDWNSPYFLDRYRKLFMALGKRYNGDPRIAWVDIRGYGNWGEGHLAGANAYHWTQFPYDDPAVNRNGTERGTLDTRLAMADAIIDAFPDTQLLAMTDDKPVLVHALKRSARIGMRRDSWGARMFGDSLLGDLTGADAQLVLNRWRTAPFIVESYGWEKVFEAGLDGIVKQVEDYHLSAIGNGNFNVTHWNDLSADKQAALLRSGNRAGYRYTPIAVSYRTDAQAGCGLALRIDWRNNGVAPSYEAWRVHAWLTGAGATWDGRATSDLPPIQPDAPQNTKLCFDAPKLPAGQYHMSITVLATADDHRTMPLPLVSEAGRYPLGTITVSNH
ncbi:hypothetical protein AEAC466_10980 [Asticcacaulis sp. AC466]|uniref:DUF4832 domain-containing protein n=1 Tax=Asticcacaulis sp. AC466 TaxID=1282362 RepID=UPI0003C3C631|nr:DUF4832 domain-containing protein [Asticcacaulis sp. AC466]ESQ83846.1 hypothetical protein AEAC466_10980 [Asticcacaulis sp. AC466]